jgi:hypothetical protein
LASTPFAAQSIEPTPATTIIAKSDLADSAPAAANQLEARIRTENWCCLPNCGRYRNRQCLQAQCSVSQDPSITLTLENIERIFFFSDLVALRYLLRN